ncbi:protein of unknown function [Pricia antarctica]|uniref:Tetratricopeptide repeat-containing protein n=1 Tax=Pricia antarctica TaxID=641691 RepID=A0A1G7FCH0_9FLAO|nr:DUF5107 domain-containing protein [Pricia antarctica]SDE73587.1 protein of unknown function [Pricia antarctica]
MIRQLSYFAFLFMTILMGSATRAQSVTIKEEIQSLETYGFSKPNPVPILAENPKIYPYFKFEEYEHTSKKKDWKVVTLENEYIKVMVLPEIGGKVWGAIEKSTGEEFLYKNEVVKFRNIAMRGPWTSGGIEFNFGIIGHHPSTATPVDYITRTNADGSVSCIVGATDLPSNTSWTVEIRLEKDKAYFETNASWYNASPLTESYYNWMTAAAVATNDLEFFIPGNTYVGHNGNAHTWPIDEDGRNLSLYKNNDFGPAKSYHVVGEYNDFFGGYYHDRNFGFGQWAPYEEMPGQKLWLWALSRSGGIWEDLLTDSDGQYIEFQAGRLLDQYSGGAINPISQVGFDPYMMDKWHEIWFPYKEIGGMVDASEEGVLNVEKDGGQLKIGLNALQNLDSKITVVLNGETSLTEKLKLRPMEIFSKSLPVRASDSIRVFIEGTELSYTNNPKTNLLKRPFNPDQKLQVSPSEQLLAEGTEAMEFREYDLARRKLSELVRLDPSHRVGLIKLAQLEYRKADYSAALQHTNSVLKMDTYNSGANYIAGITYRAMNDTINALESLGWAARDVKYRSVAFAQMAELYLASKNYQRAEIYGQKALDFNRYALNARKVLAVSARKNQQKEKFEKEITAISEIAPLDYFIQTEKSFMEGENSVLAFTNEFPSENLLGLAIQYIRFGLEEEALHLLDQDKKDTKNKIWKAFLLQKTDATKSSKLLEDTANEKVDFVSPYRRETLPVMEWAAQQSDNWKVVYYLAQNYLAVGQIEKGKSLLKALGDKPDSDIFYRFRAKMTGDDDAASASKDLTKALDVQPNDWKVWEENIQFQLKNANYKEAYGLSNKAFSKFPKNYTIGLAHAKALLNTGRFEKVLSVLKDIQVLPYEHASESRDIYERAYIGVAKSHLERKNYKKAIQILEKSKEWPENIGVGKPYTPDERAQDYLLALALKETGETEKSKELLNGIVEYSQNHLNSNSLNHLYGLLAMKKSGEDRKLSGYISKLKETSGDTNSKSKLAIALYENNTKEIEVLESENLVPMDVLEIATWSLKQ